MLQSFAEALMSARASSACGAAYGERTEERTNFRNGYRHRDWDTRVGTIDLAVPKLREGVYYPDWLLSPRRRAEQALVSVIGQAYVEGVSTSAAASSSPAASPEAPKPGGPGADEAEGCHLGRAGWPCIQDDPRPS